MAHRRASIKKIRIDKRRYEVNLRVKSELKTAAKKVKTLIAGINAADAAKACQHYFSKLDKAVKKGILHKNRASRLKSRTTLAVNALKASK